MSRGRKVTDITPEESEQIKAERKAGYLWKQIAHLHGLTDHQLSLWRAREDFEAPPAYRNGDPKKSGAPRKLDREGIVNDYNSGMSTKAVAEKYNTSAFAVSNLMKGKKCINRQIKDATRGDWGKIGALKKAGWPVKKIADEMWMDPRAIRIILTRMEERERRKGIQHVEEA